MLQLELLLLLLLKDEMMSALILLLHDVIKLYQNCMCEEWLVNGEDV